MKSPSPSARVRSQSTPVETAWLRDAVAVAFFGVVIVVLASAGGFAAAIGCVAVAVILVLVHRSRDSERQAALVSGDALERDEPLAAPTVQVSDRAFSRSHSGEESAADVVETAMRAVGVGVAVIGEDLQLRRASPTLWQLAAEWPTPEAWWDSCRDELESNHGGLKHFHDALQATLNCDVADPQGARFVFELTESSTDALLEDPAGRLVFVRNVTGQVRFEESLRESEARYALAARAARDGLWDWDLRTGQVYYAPRWRAMLGLDREEVQPNADAWFGRIHPEDLAGLEAAIQAHLEQQTDHFEFEYRILDSHGRYRWMLSRGVAVRDADGAATRLAGSQSDITERRLAEEKLRHDALYDALTGLPNRGLFMDVLGRAMRRQMRDASYGFAVLFMDLDRFKLVNDSLGHLAGDELLKRFAERLSTCVRLNDTVARLGGDEFTILLEETTDIEEAEAVADRIREELDVPFRLEGHDLFCSSSVGIAMSASDYENAAAILRDADTAMYRAKAAGKNQVVVFDRAMHAKARSLLKLHSDLRHAVEREELELQYQPIVHLPTGNLSGFEALVRWRHAERGMIWPDEFIPVAEENGLIVPMGEWVLEEACRQVLEWQREIPREVPLTVSVNLSSRSVSDRQLPETVRRVLERTQLPPATLKLELTESAVMANASQAAQVVVELKRLGVQVHVDDFGTGYSSLSYLRQFDVDALKIDRSFITKMASGAEPDPIVRAIAGLAHGLGLEIVAEGIQTRTQYQRLRELGCQYGQGYMFSRPLDPDYARALIVEDPNWSRQ